jgi:hypothetical protein
MKAWFWAPCLALASGYAGADDRITLRLADEPTSWFEVSASGSYELWSEDGNITRGVKYGQAYDPTVGLDLQIKWLHLLNFKLLGYQMFAGPELGYSYRSFDGKSFDNKVPAAWVLLDDFAMHAVYAGLTFGGGYLPGASEWGLVTYITFNLGLAFLGDVDAEAPTLFAGKAAFLDSTTNFYFSGGLGLEVRYGSFDVHAEVGGRSWGEPSSANGPIPAQKDAIVTVYVLFGLSYSF